MSLSSVKGGFLNPEEVKLLELELEANYINDCSNLFENNNDVRMSIWNLYTPIIQKTINNIVFKVAQGLIRNGKKTWLLYANEKIAGEFNSVNDIVLVLDSLQSMLTLKNIKLIPHILNKSF